MSKKDDSVEIRNISIYSTNTYDKVRTVGMSFASWLTEKRNTPVFRMVTVTAEDISSYIEKRLGQYKNGEITASTLKADISCLRKIENLVNHYYGKVSWDIPTERGARREKWGVPKKIRGENTPQRGPAYTKRQADRIVNEVEASYGRKVADALRFCRATGCRQESIADIGDKGVRASRIDTKNGTVTLLEKGGKWRTVRYDPHYQEFMERLTAQAENKESPLFAGLFKDTNASGERLEAEKMREEKKRASRHLNRVVKDAAKKEGMIGRGLHGFRKEFAVRRHAEYSKEVRSLVQSKNRQVLSSEYGVGERKARDIIEGWAKAGRDDKERRRLAKEMDTIARLKLSKDLGHNRLDVTYDYVPRKKGIRPSN
ncbi:hypothetical protein [Desulfotomaculum copahuensis]|nr:hypothetical protein [Desulfotomaculum copahuensis]